MPTCHACQADVTAAAVAVGRCDQCGAVLRVVPQRTVHDIRDKLGVDLSADAAQRTQDELDTREPQALDDTKPTINPETIQTLEIPDEHQTLAESEEVSEKPATVAFAGEQTIDFTGGSVDLELADSLVTAQWQDNISGSVGNTGATIKQKETVSSELIKRSSLFVKSREVRTPAQADSPVTSPADAPDYELLDVIGEGGMGVVYAARQSSIARTVAVKMLKGTDKHTQEQREKFISEAVVTGELDHPNIVPIYDLGSNNSGALFYSMKRVKGTPWDDVIKENSLDENLNILLRVADAVAFAHANGVLHRDLKPENVMLGDYGEVLVMDWGLARISPDFPNAEAVSQSDVMGGTPAYMAPEMATGPVELITTASDIYLLGAMLFEIVAGRPPHSGKSVMACLFNAAKNKFVEHKASGELLDIAMRAMATKPDDRYATVQDFQAALRQYQSHSESVLLTDNASKNLEAAIDADDYELYSRALYGFQEALSLWSENRRASELLSAARGAYAQSALERSDFDLGISLLEGDSQHEELCQQLIAGRDERESRNRRLALMKRAVAALLLAVVGIVSVAYVAVRAQRNEAITQRDRADENYRQAEAARAAEETQRKEAVSQRQEAVRQKGIADVQRDEANAARDRADKAKQAEEYEAYVARIGLANAKIEENSFDRAAEILDQCDPKLRNWEWGRLAYLCQLSRQTWALEGPVEAVAVSADGRYFASGDWAGHAKLWDLESGAELQSHEHGQYVHAVAFSPAGGSWASASSDGTVRVYRIDDGQLLHTLMGHTDAVTSVRFSSSGDRLLTASFDNTARIWSLVSGKVEQTLAGHSWWVWAAEYSPDDQRIVTASQDGKAIVWQRDQQGNYQRLTEFAKHSGPIYAAQFSPDGTWIATAGYDRRVLMWNPDEVRPVDVARRLDALTDPPAPYQELTRHAGPIRTLAFSLEGDQLVSGGQDNVIRIWDFTADREIATLRGHASHVRDCAFAPDGETLLSAGRDQQIKLWQPKTYGESLVLGRDAADGQPSDAVLDARYSHDGKQVVTASRDRTATLWDANTQTMLHRFAEGHDFLASTSAFFADGTRLATGAGDGTLRVWDVAVGTELFALEGTGRTAALAVSADGRWLATGNAATDVVVWDANTGEQVATLAGHEAAITVVAFAADGHTLASGDELGRCRLWTFDQANQSWQASRELTGHSRAITALAFVDQGKRLLSASGDNTCGQWDVASGQELRELVLTHPNRVVDMAVSADGHFAWTACDDGALRLWNVQSAQMLQEIRPTVAKVFTSVDLSSDGKTALAASAAAGTVQLWNLETGEELTSADDGVWLRVGEGGGTLWSAKFSPQGDRVLTIGGNDARLWDIATAGWIVRYSPHGAVASADISPDGKLLATGSWDQSAKVWDIATGRALRKFDGVHLGFVNSVQFSPKGDNLLTASDDGTARLWDVSTGQPVQPIFRGHESRVRQARFSADGTRVLTTSNDKTTRIWDRQTGELLQTLVGHQWAVLCGEFSSDGSKVITGSEDNTAQIWDVASGELLLKLAGHTDSITGVALSPDGTRAMTASLDNTAKLWDAETGKEILTLVGHAQELTSVSFSPDGQSVLTSGRDGVAIVWPALQWTESSTQ